VKLVMMLIVKIAIKMLVFVLSANLVTIKSMADVPSAQIQLCIAMSAAVLIDVKSVMKLSHGYLKRMVSVSAVFQKITLEKPMIHLNVNANLDMFWKTIPVPDVIK